MIFFLFFSLPLSPKICHFPSRFPAKDKYKHPTAQWGGGGVLQILSDGDDQMGVKIKTQKKSLGLPEQPKN